MKTTTAAIQAPFGAITTFRFVEFFGSLAQSFRVWNETRRTVAMLRNLTPTQLDDIGLTPGDIDEFARTGRW